MGFRIKQYAYEQGMKLGDVARKLHMPLSNLSAIASGRRSVSVPFLSKIAGLLHCRVSELFDEESMEPAAYRRADLNRAILRVESENYFGREKGWTHRLMLAQRRHYSQVRLKGS